MFFITALRRKRLKRSPFPAEWLQLLESGVPVFKRLPEADKEELRQHMLVFLAEKTFSGAGGLAVTDEMRIVVAASACLLLLHRNTDYYPGLSSIVIYPGEYIAKLEEMDEAGVVTESLDRRSGEYSRDGAVVLSWEDVLAEGLDVHEAYNVVLHEFAHQIDAESGLSAAMYDEGHVQQCLGRTLRREFVRLKREVRRGRATVLDAYGTEHPAEFFAVATECFFERPASLRAHLPELYAGLARFYRQDPCGWAAPATMGSPLD